MKTVKKYSRRQVTMALINMIKAGASVKQVAQVLATYLIKTNQTRSVELYIRDIELAILEHFGVATVRVFSVNKLSQAPLTRVRQLVSSSSGAKRFEMIEKRDPELIGGIVVKTADYELDGSVRTKLRNLRSV